MLFRNITSYVSLILLLCSTQELRASGQQPDPESTELILKMLTEDGKGALDYDWAVRHQGELIQDCNGFNDEEDRLRLSDVKLSLTDNDNGQLSKLKDVMAEITAKQKAVMNVHDYNHLLCPFASIVMGLNKRLGLNAQQTLPVCLEKLRKLRSSLEDKEPICEAELLKLATFFTAEGLFKNPNGPICQTELETNMPVLEMLSCLVDFMEKSSYSETDLRSFFARLEENTQLGGCPQGYVGRMMACNVDFLLRLFRAGPLSICFDKT